MNRREFFISLVVAGVSIFGVVLTISALTSRAAGQVLAIEPETGSLSGSANIVTQAGASGGQAVKFSSGVASPFTLGMTKPTLANPDSPTATDNVGAAYGWNGVSLAVMNGDQTIPANTTWSNKLIHGYVTFTDSTSKLTNSVVDGRAPGGAFKSGLVNGANGGQLDRVTLRASAAAAEYYLNGLTSTGGDWTITRTDISRIVDGVHVNGNGAIKMLGCRVHDFSFFDDDQDHASDSAHPYWTHNDSIQRLSGNGEGDWLEGNSLESFFDTTGVTWSGGSWGSGTASGGLIGMPATALNGGYWNAFGKGNWANMITYSNIAPYTGMTFLNNWFDGGNHPSGMVQMTVTGAHSFRLEGNRWGLGGKPSSANKIFLATYASSSTVNTGPAGSNVFDSTADTPVSLRGDALTFGVSGASIILP